MHRLARRLVVLGLLLRIGSGRRRLLLRRDRRALLRGHLGDFAIDTKDNSLKIRFCAGVPTVGADQRVAPIVQADSVQRKPPSLPRPFDMAALTSLPAAVYPGSPP